MGFVLDLESMLFGGGVQLEMEGAVDTQQKWEARDVADAKNRRERGKAPEPRKDNPRIMDRKERGRRDYWLCAVTALVSGYP